jgi:hypothetical protein
MTGRPNRPHHQGDYARRASLVRANAYANPATRCWRCNGLAKYDDPWQAGHVVDGEPGGELRPEHRSCNASAGATHGNQQREPRSEHWY